VTNPRSLKIIMPLLASIMALSPLAIDLYLPAMPSIAQDMATDISLVQNTLSVYLLGYAIGLMLFGPLADKISRRTLVMFGLSGFLAASVGLIFCQTITQFLLLRGLQALLGSAATVVVSGTVRELYGKDTAKGLSYVSMIMMLAPLAAPSIGSALLQLGHWPLIFYALTGYTALVLLAAWRLLPERSNLSTQQQHSFVQRYRIVLGHGSARLDLISSMMVSLAFFAYLTASPFVYMTVFNVSEWQFSLLFGLNVGALMLAHFTNTRLVSRIGSRVMLRAGLVLASIAVTALVMVSSLSLSLIYTVLAIFPLMGSISMIAVNSDALVLTEFAEHSGTATAVIGTLRFGVGALAGPMLSYFFDGSAQPFAWLMFVAIFVVAACQYLHYRTELKSELKL
jgi:MFS transporter, DHA1 family, multidrug resistance protein